MDEINGGKEFTYQTVRNQLKMLQLLSTGATQHIIYECLNSAPQGTRFTAHNDLEIDSAEVRFRRTTQINVIDDCTKDNQWHKAVFSISTNVTTVLPIKDMLLFDVGQDNQQFGIQVGNACFS